MSYLRWDFNYMPLLALCHVYGTLFKVIYFVEINGMHIYSRCLTSCALDYFVWWLNFSKNITCVG